MTQTIEPPATAAATPRPARWIAAWRAAAWVLVVGWTAVTLLVVFGGEVQANKHDLRSDVHRGQVAVVHVEGRIPTRGPVEAHWRTSPVTAYRATMDVNRLRNLGVPVERREPRHDDVSIMDRHVEGGAYAILGLVGLLIWTIVLLALSPWVRRGTAFGWFWPIWMLAPVGPLLYLVLGGPLARGTPPPPDRRRLLTGGWSFVLCVVIVSLLRTDA